jgi:hypothetical protein
VGSFTPLAPYLPSLVLTTISSYQPLAAHAALAECASTNHSSAPYLNKLPTNSLSSTILNLCQYPSSILNFNTHKHKLIPIHHKRRDNVAKALSIIALKLNFAWTISLRAAYTIFGCKDKALDVTPCTLLGRVCVGDDEGNEMAAVRLKADHVTLRHNICQKFRSI